MTPGSGALQRAHPALSRFCRPGGRAQGACELRSDGDPPPGHGSVPSRRKASSSPRRTGALGFGVIWGALGGRGHAQTAAGLPAFGMPLNPACCWLAGPSALDRLARRPGLISAWRPVSHAVCGRGAAWVQRPPDPPSRDRWESRDPSVLTALSPAPPHVRAQAVSPLPPLRCARWASWTSWFGAGEFYGRAARKLFCAIRISDNSALTCLGWDLKFPCQRLRAGATPAQVRARRSLFSPLGDFSLLLLPF